MSGIPRPVDDLPAGSISVRLIRGSLSNNITGHPVELHVGGRVLTVRTDDSGRAQFDKVSAGSTVKATADVDGEHLESQEFPAPAQGGVRLMLVATDKNAPPATQPDAAAITGQVVITNQSRIVMEPGDETVNVFYLLDINNSARVPVNPPSLFAFELPKEATGSGIMEGSSPQAALSGRRIVVNGPFAPGHTFVQVGMAMPSTSGSIDVTLTPPANMESLAVIAQKVGDARLMSAQLTNQREMPAEGRTYIAAMGGPINAGQTISLTLIGLPHHSTTPRWIAMAIAAAILGVGLYASGRPVPSNVAEAQERKRLVARRDKLLNELVRLESDRRAGRPGPGSDVAAAKLAARREELMAALEQVYGALDSDGGDPEPAERAAA